VVPNPNKLVGIFLEFYYFCHEDIEQKELHPVSLSAGGIFRLFGAIIQWAPKRKSSHWDRGDEEHAREIRILDKSKVMLFDMPKPIKYLLSAHNTTLAVLQLSGSPKACNNRQTIDRKV
jgi:hypothetical protein